MESLILKNATLYTGDRVLTHHALWLEAGKIRAILPDSEVPDGVAVRDMAGAWLVPGFVDFQLYGGSTGFLTRDGSVEALTNMYQTHRQDGTTTIVPTVYSTTEERILAAVEAIKSYWQAGLPGVAGLHVEGPFISHGQARCAQREHGAPAESGGDQPADR